MQEIARQIQSGSFSFKENIYISM